MKRALFFVCALAVIALSLCMTVWGETAEESEVPAQNPAPAAPVQHTDPDAAAVVAFVLLAISSFVMLAALSVLKKTHSFDK